MTTKSFILLVLVQTLHLVGSHVSIPTLECGRTFVCSQLCVETHNPCYPPEGVVTRGNNSSTLIRSQGSLSYVPQ